MLQALIHSHSLNWIELYVGMYGVIIVSTFTDLCALRTDQLTENVQSVNQVLQSAKIYLPSFWLKLWMEINVWCKLFCIHRSHLVTSGLPNVNWKERKGKESKTRQNKRKQMIWWTSEEKVDNNICIRTNIYSSSFCPNTVWAVSEWH